MKHFRQPCERGPADASQEPFAQSAGMAHSPSGKWIDAIRPDGPVCESARLSLEARLVTLAHHMPLAAYHTEQDPEHVHRLRVSTRRAAAALKLYRDWQPRKRGRWIEKRVKKLRRAAGDARDLDVLAERLQRQEGPRACGVLELIARERVAVQPGIIRIAQRFSHHDQFVRKVSKLVAAIRCDQDVQSEGVACFQDWAARQLALHVEQFFGTLPREDADLAALHRFRIAAKALRYSIELLVSALPRDVRQIHYRTIEELQSRLGKVNDHLTARDRLRSWAAQVHEAALQDALCEIAEEEVALLTEELAAWWEWWTPERVERLQRGLAR